MDKKKIKVNWTRNGVGARLSYEGYFEYRFLSEHFDLEISDDPDYLFCDVYSYDDLRQENCIKILRTEENGIPDFNRYDYAIGFDYIDYGDRYLRCPLYPHWGSYRLMAPESVKLPPDDELLNRKFCSFVVSNGTAADPMRDYFFTQLSKYKRVDSGGRHLNNIGGRIRDKQEFCAQYKFNIAFENSVSPGYVTEKIMDPLTVHSVPIYYGDPRIYEEFSPECMVRVRDRDDVERAIAEIVSLDRDDAAYLGKCKAAGLVHSWDYHYECEKAFLLNIFDQPFDRARRLSGHGSQLLYRKKLLRMATEDYWLRLPFRRAKSFLRKLASYV